MKRLLQAFEILSLVIACGIAVTGNLFMKSFSQESDYACGTFLALAGVMKWAEEYFKEG